MPLPSYERTSASPPLSPEGSAIAIAKSGDGLVSDIVLHGSYRILDPDRAMLGPHRFRHQVWLLAVERSTRAVFFNRPGRDALVFGEEEPDTGTIEGWFQIQVSG